MTIIILKAFIFVSVTTADVRKISERHGKFNEVKI